jgi:D-3-phosphoglycerate dehydrogenase / 2-oxoglutarate reductase
VLEPIAEGINMVNAPAVAKERKVEVSEVKNEDAKDYSNMIRITVGDASVAGSVLGKGKPRLVEINEFPLEAAIGKTLLYVKNEDKPGLIGNVGTILGNNKINIANFHLGRSDSGAVALIEVDGDLSDKVLAEIAKVPTVLLAKVFRF